MFNQKRMQMKKILLSLVALLTLVATASAGVPVNGKARKALSADALVRQLATKNVAVKKAPAKDVSIISQQPAGELKTYTRSGSGYYGDYDEKTKTTTFELLDQEGLTMNIVYAEDGETVYIQDPISYLGAGTWVKGTLNAEKTLITVPLGQYLYYWSGYGYGLALVLQNATLGQDGLPVDEGLTTDATATEITYAIEGEKISLQGTSATKVLGAEFAGYGISYDVADFESVYAPFAEEVVTVPADADLLDYTLATSKLNDDYEFDDVTYQVKVAVSGNDFYLQGFNEWLPEAWVKGTIDGNKLTIPTGQYLGMYSGSAIYFVASSTGETLSDAEFTIADGVYTTESAFIINGKKNEFYYYDWYSGAVIAPKGDEPGPGPEPEKLTPVYDQMVSEQPAGTLRSNLYRQGYGYYASWFGIYSFDADGKADDIVEGADGSVWLKNPFGQLSTNTWLKFERGNGDELILKTPQLIYEETYQDYDPETYEDLFDENDNPIMVTDQYLATRLDYTLVEEDGETYYSYELNPKGEMDIKFSYKDGVLEQLPNADGYYSIIGLTDFSGGWTGYGDYAYYVSEQTDKVVSLPETAKVEEYVLETYESDTSRKGEVVNVAFDGNDIYLNVTPETTPNAWVKGAISGDKVEFLSGQYTGVQNGYHTYFKGATWAEYYDEYYEENDWDYFATPSVVFAYDADGKTLSTDSAFAYCQGKLDFNYTSIYDEADLYPWVEVAATPADPSFADYMDYDEVYEYGAVLVNVPTRDVEGNFINGKNMYYNLYVDNEKIVLGGEYLDPEFNDIPENLMNSADIPVSLNLYDLATSGQSHTFYFYFAGAESFSVQSFYTAKGETRASNLVTTSVEVLTGIKQAVEKNVQSVKWYDLSGRQVSAPSKGIYVKQVTFTDGKVMSGKVIRK